MIKALIITSVFAKSNYATSLTCVLVCLHSQLVQNRKYMSRYLTAYICNYADLIVTERRII